MSLILDRLDEIAAAAPAFTGRLDPGVQARGLDHDKAALGLEVDHQAITILGGDVVRRAVAV
jgi:hypothetical protein